MLIGKVFRLAKNDYFVVIYRLMLYLYNCLKDDRYVDLSKITPKYLGVNDRYFQENSTIAKVKKSVKGLSDTIGNVTPL